MANNNLLKKIAPVVLSATVAMTGMPSAAFAAEFSDEEVVLDERAEDEASGCGDSRTQKLMRQKMRQIYTIAGCRRKYRGHRS